MLNIGLFANYNYAGYMTVGYLKGRGYLLVVYYDFRHRFWLNPDKLGFKQRY